MVNSRYSYSLLPTHKDGLEKPVTIPSYFRVLFSRRIARFAALVVLTFASFTFAFPHTPTFRAQRTAQQPQQPSEYPAYPIPRDVPPQTSEGPGTLPPLYQEYAAYEDALPQHDDSLPFPEGLNGKFVFFANHPWGTGWGNVMQSMLLEAHLALASGRT